MVAKNFEHVNCVVCGKDDTEKFSKKGQFGLPANVVICKQCGISYLNPRWTKERAVRYYKEDFDWHYRPEIYVKGSERFFAYEPVLERLKKYNLIPEQSGKILDVGSGDGVNIGYLMKQMPNHEYYAIEPSPTCQDILQKMNVNMLGTDVDDDFHLGYEGAFDLIILRHVLEHFFDPVAVLTKLNTLLSENGIIYIAVPNCLKVGNGKLLDLWFRAAHTYYFNVHSIRNVFNMSALEEEVMLEGDEHHATELIAIVRKGEKKSPTIDSKYFDMQKEVYLNRLKEETKLPNQIKRWIRNDILLPLKIRL